MEEFNVVIPKDLENLKLPDPSLVDEYFDRERRIVRVCGEIDSGDHNGCYSSDIVNAILRYNIEDRLVPVEERKPIWILLDTTGGDVSGTSTIIGAIETSKTPVYTVNIHDALSCGAIISLNGHKRFALKRTNFLIHTGSVYFGGTKELAESAKKYYDKVDARLTDTIYEKTKIDKKSYRAKASKDWWMDEEDAIKYGVIDKIIGIDEIA